MRAEKPKWFLSVIAGAVLRTMHVVASGIAEYLGYLEKGQLPPARLSLTSFQHMLVLEGAPGHPLAFKAATRVLRKSSQQQFGGHSDGGHS